MVLSSLFAVQCPVAAVVADGGIHTFSLSVAQWSIRMSSARPIGSTYPASHTTEITYSRAEDRNWMCNHGLIKYAEKVHLKKLLSKLDEDKGR